ncbi:MAG: pyruvate ferredoxin oxidoreductase [Methanobacteriota archaeon]|nr:MAG: pyruvate ferredoxin oxidoreductase [Euryarchaeota archaeon]
MGVDVGVSVRGVPQVDLAISGNDAVALAMKQINPDVVAAYPITPQTLAMEKFSEYVHNGEVDTELICVESEHSAMSACIGACAAGGRVMTSTAANGLAFMFEVVYIAASYRLPIVMAVMNRAFGGPINIHCDHTDTMGVRDSGWIQLFAENVQEVYDNTIQAVRIAEHPDVRLPVISAFDGFILSHATERVSTLGDDDVKRFVGPYKAYYPLLDFRNPVTWGPFDLYDYYFEHKRQVVEAMRNAYKVIKEVGREYEKLSGRSYGLVEGYNLEDADKVLVIIGSTAGTARQVVESSDGLGLLKIRVFRPFPHREVVEALSGRDVVAVFDRSDSFGALGGPLFQEVRNALYDAEEKPKVIDYVYGLGGRDIRVEEIRWVAEKLERVRLGEKVDVVNYLGVRE